MINIQPLLWIFLSTLYIIPSKALKCYDSQSAKPDRINKCNENEVFLSKSFKNSYF